MAIDLEKYKLPIEAVAPKVDLSKYKIQPTQSLSDSIWGSLAGYGSRLKEDYLQGGQNIISGIEKGAEQVAGGILDIQAGKPFQGGADILGGFGRSALRTVGQVAQTAFAPATAALSPLIEEQLSKDIKNQPEFYQKLQPAIEKMTELATKYPEYAKDIQNVVDIATLGIGSAAEKPVIKEAGALASDISRGAKELLTPSEAAIEKNIQSLFQKGIKPLAKKTEGQAVKYESDVLKALKTIKDNSATLNIEDATGELISGRTPQTINELSQAVDQTKKSVFAQYDALAKQANKVGATVDAVKIADEVAAVADNRALQLTNPEVVNYALKWAERLRSFDRLDAETTQEVIKNLNNSLQAFYRNPTYEAASKVTIDAGIANNFRKLLDEAIEGATGKEYQALKNQYSALKAIENDVTKASMRDARKNVKGLLDYTDIFTSGQMVSGIFSMNPAMFTKGAVERGFKEYFKYLNDPNRAIEKIFKQLDIVPAEGFTPESEIGKWLKDPKIGLMIEDVSGKAQGGIPKTTDLLSEARKFKTAEEFVKAKQSLMSASQIKSKYPNIELGIYEKPTEIVLDKIIVPKGDRSAGVGTNVMNDLIKYADQTEKRIVLTPSKDYGASSVSRLTDFYKRFGFIENKGNLRDFSTRESMIRNPKSQLTDLWEKANKK